jgi:hypothetical protein
MTFIVDWKTFLLLLIISFAAGYWGGRKVLNKILKDKREKQREGHSSGYGDFGS